MAAQLYEMLFQRFEERNPQEESEPAGRRRARTVPQVAAAACRRLKQSFGGIILDSGPGAKPAGYRTADFLRVELFREVILRSRPRWQCRSFLPRHSAVLRDNPPFPAASFQRWSSRAKRLRIPPIPRGRACQFLRRNVACL